MERHYYSGESLDVALRSLEEHYGIVSAEFYARYAGPHAADLGVPRAVAATWAGILEERDRVRQFDSGLGKSVERVVAVA